MHWPLFAGLAFASSIKQPHQQPHQHSDVLIVGGGISGLAAVLELLKHSSSTNSSTLSVVLLEAKDRLGGRMHTLQLENGIPVDLGGMYWHGSNERGVWQQLQEIYNFASVDTGGTSMHPCSDTAVWKRGKHYADTTDGSLVSMTDAEVESLHRIWDDWYDFCEMKRNDLPHAVAPNATERLLRTWRAEFLQNKTSLEQATMMFEEKGHTLDLGIEFYETAFDGIESDWDWVDFDGPDVILQNGMRDVVDAMASTIQQSPDAQIHLNERASTIEYNNDSCRIATEQGNVYTADSCIVTLPIGVLKRRADSLFFPPLPRFKAQALSRAGVGVLNTISVACNRKFDAGAYYVVGGDPTNPLSHGFVCPGEFRGKGNVAQFHVSDTNHNFFDLKVWKDHARNVVQAVFPDDDNLEILDVVVSAWHLDPDFLGSYSAPTAETRGNADRRMLAKSVGALHFAGEHTHYRGRYQSIDGAYETGVRAAWEICKHRKSLE